MTSLQRVVLPSAIPVPPGLLWRGVAGVLTVAALFVLRACDYDFVTAASYAWYFAAYVALPGIVVMSFVNRGPLSLSQVVALALPTGFAVEIFSYLGLAALGAKAAYAWTPLLWGGLVAAQWGQNRRWPVCARIAGNHAGICLGLGLVFLATAIMAASQMFAEAPLASGLPTRAIFHDWVYLVSRAGAIKNTWPLDDPSLSGTPLQYHYFMMVHAAAASWTTGVEISTVMLRLVFVPLGAVLVMQVFVLGRAMSRSAWGGVLAAFLVVVTSEMSQAPSYGEPMFLGLFARWLFVSPTFFFGMIFCGALLLGIARGVRQTRWDLRGATWLLMLGAAGTGAKGTLLPVIVCALGLWAAWQMLTQRKVPWRIVAFGALLTAAFAIVYLPTMLAWRTGDARFRPFHVFALTEFWKFHLPLWQAGLAGWLPKAIASPIATLACAAVVFAGTCGVQLLALPFLFWGDLENRDARLAGWLGAFFVACAGMGLLLELNSYGELYLILMIRLPMAVLTAAFFVAALRRVRAWRSESSDGVSTGSRSPFARRSAAAVAGTFRGARVAIGFSAAVLAVALMLQTSIWLKRNSRGLAAWLNTPTDLRPDDYMQDLQEAMLWVRENTEPDAVLVANAFTPENMKKDNWERLDHTLAGVHFYYSALSERRLWFEGPNYIMDTTRARLRASMASGFFYRGWHLRPQVVSSGPCYVLIDRSLNDGARVRLSPDLRVFANSRLEVFKLGEVAADD